jgi:hypothetical protein
MHGLWSWSILPLVVCGTPALGGGGSGGGAAVGAQSGGPMQMTSHWLRHAVTLEPPSGPSDPAAGQPQPPVPVTKQGAQEDFCSPDSVSYIRCMHFEPERTPVFVVFKSCLFGLEVY